MISLKRKDTGDSGLEAYPEESPYPWGTSLTLETETLEALGVDLAVGDDVMVMAIATVTSRSENESAEGRDHKSVSLQLTELEVKQPNGKTKAAIMYGEDG